MRVDASEWKRSFHSRPSDHRPRRVGLRRGHRAGLDGRHGRSGGRRLTSIETRWRRRLVAMALGMTSPGLDAVTGATRAGSERQDDRGIVGFRVVRPAPIRESSAGQANVPVRNPQIQHRPHRPGRSPEQGRSPILPTNGVSRCSKDAQSWRLSTRTGRRRWSGRPPLHGVTVRQTMNARGVRSRVEETAASSQSHAARPIASLRRDCPCSR